MTRRIAPATVGDGGDGLARTWLVLWPEIEPTPRKYQEPVSVERVLAEHVAAVAALAIIEGMGTCAAPIAAHAADTQAGEAGIAGPQKEARSTGSLDRSDALAPDRARGVVPYAFRVPSRRAAHTGNADLDETKFSGSPDLLFISNDVA